MLYRRFLLVPFKKGVELSFCFEADKGVEMYPVQTVENTFFNIGICLFQLPYQLLDFSALSAARLTDKFRVGKAAGALDKFQLVVARPCDNIVLMHAVERTDQFHSLKVGAFELCPSAILLQPSSFALL